MRFTCEKLPKDSVLLRLVSKDDTSKYPIYTRTVTLKPIDSEIVEVCGLTDKPNFQLKRMLALECVKLGYQFMRVSRAVNDELIINDYRLTATHSFRD